MKINLLKFFLENIIEKPILIIETVIFAIELAFIAATFAGIAYCTNTSSITYAAGPRKLKFSYKNKPFLKRVFLLF